MLVDIGAKCLCPTEAMGRSILGVATIKATKPKTFYHNIWTCHGGKSC